MRIILAMLLSLLLLPLSVAASETAKAPTQYIEVGSVKIAYRTVGSGSPLLLTNRLRGTLDTWDPAFIDELASTRKVIMFDYPGVGYSTGSLPPDMIVVSDFVAAFARELGLSKFDVLGWSWGGALAQTFLVRHPHMVDRAILVGTNPPGQNELPMQAYWFERAVKPVNDLADEEVLFFEPDSEASLAAAKASHDRIYSRPGVSERIPSTMEEFKLFFDAAQKYKQDKEGIRESLGKSSVPMLILCGDNDPSVPAENWYPLVGVIPNGQFIVLPQSGHGPQHQYPELSAAYIHDFLQQASPAR